MAGKIYNKAKRCLRLRNSGLFNDDRRLESAILVAVIQGVCVLYLREEQEYHLIRLTSNSYEPMLKIDEPTKLGLDELVAIVEQYQESGRRASKAYWDSDQRRSNSVV
jgi:hypothetical protein